MRTHQTEGRKENEWMSTMILHRHGAFDQKKGAGVFSAVAGKLAIDTRP